MPPTKNMKDRAGNTEELDRLEEEIARLNKVQQEILSDKRDLQATLGKKEKEIQELKISNAELFKKLKEYERPEQTAGTGESAKEGFVDIAIVPHNGMYPIATKMGDLVVPRKKDEHGIAYESIPVKLALAKLAEKNLFKKYLVGPCDKIEGDVPMQQAIPHGMYNKHLVFERHKKMVEGGKVVFVKVEVVDPVEKTE